MTVATGHLYVLRMLRALLAGPEQYLFRIDPDTLVWRTFTKLPSFTCLFGTMETISEGQSDEIQSPPNIQGGCIGMTRDAASAIVESGLLTQDNCADNCYTTWVRCRDMELTVARGRCSDDFIMSWAAGSLDIPIIDYSEIRSRWRRPISNHNLRYAVTHPHKSINGAVSELAVPVSSK